MPAEYDLELERGDNTPVVIRLKTKNSEGTLVPVNLSGSEMVLMIWWRGGSIMKTTADNGMTLNGPAGETTWVPTVDETLNLPKGKIADWEFERRVPGGEQRTYIRGKVTASGGRGDA